MIEIDGNSKAIIGDHVYQTISCIGHDLFDVVREYHNMFDEEKQKASSEGRSIIIWRRRPNVTEEMGSFNARCRVAFIGASENQRDEKDCCLDTHEENLSKMEERDRGMHPRDRMNKAIKDLVDKSGEKCLTCHYSTYFNNTLLCRRTPKPVLVEEEHWCGEWTCE